MVPPDLAECAWYIRHLGPETGWRALVVDAQWLANVGTGWCATEMTRKKKRWGDMRRIGIIERCLKQNGMALLGRVSSRLCVTALVLRWLRCIKVGPHCLAFN